MIFSREFLAALVARRPAAPSGPDPVDRTVDAHRRIDKLQQAVHDLSRRVDAIPAAAGAVPDRAITRREAAMLPTGTLITASIGGTRMTLMAVGPQPGVAYVDAPTGSWHALDDLDVRAGIAVLWTPGGTR